jgi:putative membrane protein
VTHHDPAALVEAELQATVLAAVAVVYLAATRRLCRRSTTWPRWRTARWLVGVATAITGAVVLSLGGHDLRLHVAGHLLLGMLAPVLLVTAAPVTLALRALSRERARVLGRLLRSRPLAVLTHPAVAALLDVGGLWLLYRTDVPATVPPLVVHVHMLLAGYLFAFALIGPDPAPHRPGFAVRTGVLVVAVAAHDVLAKLLYATPPPGVTVAQAEVAGLLMYYGAAPVHVALFALLGREWLAAQRRARERAGRRPSQPVGRGTAAAARLTAYSAASQVENASQSPGAAARISAGVGRPSTPPSATPASRANSRPAATSQSLVPASTAQSNRPHAR